MKSLWIAAAATLLLGLGSQSGAATVASTNISYFTVNGTTPAEIYRSIVRKGPRVDGDRAIASAKATAIQDGKLTPDGNMCRVTDYRVKLVFTITRPRIKNEKVLPPRDRALWKQFTSFVEAHENEHKQVWLSCASELERKVKAIRASNCDKAAAQTNAMWKKMLANCDRKQKSFDAAQAEELIRQPFIQRALSGAR